MFLLVPVFLRSSPSRSYKDLTKTIPSSLRGSSLPRTTPCFMDNKWFLNQYIIYHGLLWHPKINHQCLTLNHKSHHVIAKKSSISFTHKPSRWKSFYHIIIFSITDHQKFMAFWGNDPIKTHQKPSYDWMGPFPTVPPRWTPDLLPVPTAVTTPSPRPTRPRAPREAQRPLAPPGCHGCHGFGYNNILLEFISISLDSI